jgi:hypothetical protein
MTWVFVLDASLVCLLARYLPGSLLLMSFLGHSLLNKI